MIDFPKITSLLSGQAPLVLHVSLAQQREVMESLAESLKALGFDRVHRPNTQSVDNMLSELQALVDEQSQTASEAPKVIWLVDGTLPDWCDLMAMLSRLRGKFELANLRLIAVVPDTDPT